MTENEDGSGFKTEPNLQTAYRADRDIIKVSKVSNRGWSVTHYIEGDDGIETEASLGSHLNAQEAQRIAQMEVK